MQLGSRASQHNFATTPDIHMARSQFDRSFASKDTYDFDDIVPIFVDEILPGDTINLKMATFQRLSTQKVPIMDNLYINFFYFFVPNRLVWDNWEKFNGAQDNPGDSTDFIIPQVVSRTTTGEVVGSIWDKMGLVTQVPGLSVSALPFRAYNLIWNTWFRDENMQNSLVVKKDNGPDDIVALYSTLAKRGRRHDYFTSALPSPQKGPAVTLPLGTSAPVIGSNGNITLNNVNDATVRTLSLPTSGVLTTTTGPSTAGNARWAATGMITDLSSATAATINQLRQAFSIQGMYELDNRGGTRYVEILKAHFNVVSPDFRLQRPEYLGGGQIRINAHPVAQTAPTSGTNAQGALAAFATASTQDSDVNITKSFVEHGYVLGFACARADQTYQQGVNRMWTRNTRFDFFWPKLQELGEQAILNKEIYAVGSANAAQDAAVFGYQERYAEYRFMPSIIKGQFRSSYATSLDFWHMAQQFGSLPVLGANFIQQYTPINRAITVASAGSTLIADYYFSYKHARPMMAYSVPSTLGHF